MHGDQRAAVDERIIMLPDDMKTVIGVAQQRRPFFYRNRSEHAVFVGSARKLWARAIGTECQQLLLKTAMINDNPEPDDIADLLPGRDFGIARLFHADAATESRFADQGEHRPANRPRGALARAAK